MKYQPIEMKAVLTKLREALTAGRSEIENTLNCCTVEASNPLSLQRFNASTFNE
jgi:hypothetical protein